MMEPNDLDPMSRAAVVTRVIDDIDQSSDDERDTLLRDFLRAAWGTLAGQDQ